VIASHGRRGLAHALLGSVAESVIRGSKVPVTVVRQAA
jgi:nucleotide-binding universal stress UspA family protein